MDMTAIMQDLREHASGLFNNPTTNNKLPGKFTATDKSPVNTYAHCTQFPGLPASAVRHNQIAV